MSADTISFQNPIGKTILPYLLPCSCPIINIYNLGWNISKPMRPTYTFYNLLICNLLNFNMLTKSPMNLTLSWNASALRFVSEICSVVFKYLDLLLSDQVHFLSRITLNPFMYNVVKWPNILYFPLSIYHHITSFRSMFLGILYSVTNITDIKLMRNLEK